MTVQRQPVGNGRPRITIADVARAAGVSQSAVSFALNERPGIADETRARILRVAEDLGWHPSARARALANSKANAVGLILNRPVELLSADPFFSQFLAGLEMVLSPADQALVLQVITGDEEITAKAYRRMADTGRVDGFVLTDPRHDDPRFPLLEDLGLPAVVAGDPSSGGPFPAFGPDEMIGTAAAVRHLIDLGHERIAYVSGPLHLGHARTRARAWIDTMEAAGLAHGTPVVGDFTSPGGARATEEVLAVEPSLTAIVYGNDLMAMSGLAVLRRHGLRVPEDVSVVGYDDVELAAHTTPAFTTVRQDVVGNGREVAEQLLARISGTEARSCPAQRPELIVRDSTAAPTGPIASTRR